MQIISTFGWARLKYKVIQILSNPLCIFDGPRYWIYCRVLQIRVALMDKLPQKKSAHQYLREQCADIDADTCAEMKDFGWLTEGAPCQFHMIGQGRSGEIQNKVLKFVCKESRDDAPDVTN